MDGLDFSALSDDQLLGLVRAALREVTSRSPALAEATRAAMLDEAERARVYAEATEREAAKLRAAERARIAEEAAEHLRQQRAAQEAEAARLRGAAAGEAARQQELAKQRNRMAWLQRASAVVGVAAPELTLLLVNTRHGRRVLINHGADRYTHDHLVDYDVASKRLSTKRSILPRKGDAAALCAELAATYPTQTVEWVGQNLDWSLAA